jgi:uncharacterized protein YcfJ
MVASLALPVAVGTASVAEAKPHKYCKKVATAYANKKTNKRVVRDMVIGGVVGGLIGSAVGGKKSTVFGAAGGAGLGMVNGGSKWEKYYWSRYESCRDE